MTNTSNNSSWLPWLAVAIGIGILIGQLIVSMTFNRGGVNEIETVGIAMIPPKQKTYNNYDMIQTNVTLNATNTSTFWNAQDIIDEIVCRIIKDGKVYGHGREGYIGSYSKPGLFEVDFETAITDDSFIATEDNVKCDTVRLKSQSLWSRVAENLGILFTGGRETVGTSKGFIIDGEFPSAIGYRRTALTVTDDDIVSVSCSLNADGTKVSSAVSDDLGDFRAPFWLLLEYKHKDDGKSAVEYSSVCIAQKQHD